MKIELIAAGMMLLLVAFAIVNALVVGGMMRELWRDVEAITAESDEEAGRAEARMRTLYERFLREEKYITLTVNHEDITNIEGAFAEAIGGAEAEDEASFLVARSRLLDAIEHLRRLAGVSAESIL